MVQDIYDHMSSSISWFTEDDAILIAIRNFHASVKRMQKKNKDDEKRNKDENAV